MTKAADPCVRNLVDVHGATKYPSPQSRTKLRKCTWQAHLRGIICACSNPSACKLRHIIDPRRAVCNDERFEVAIAVAHAQGDACVVGSLLCSCVRQGSIPCNVHLTLEKRLDLYQRVSSVSSMLCLEEASGCENTDLSLIRRKKHKVQSHSSARKPVHHPTPDSTYSVTV